MIDGIAVTAAFALGAMGSAHCVGMCGGIGTALGLAADRQRWRLAVCYNAGRIGTYAALGAIAGAVSAAAGAALQSVLPQIALVLRTLAGLLVVAMGLYVGGWWLGLTRLEAAGAGIWRHVRPLAQRCLPPRNARAALLLGAAWGMLPCGLVYSSLAWAALGADPVRGATLMAAFGAGTLPAMLLATVCGTTLATQLRRPAVRRIAGTLLVVFGAIGAALPWRHVVLADHTHHVAQLASRGAQIPQCH